VSDEIKVTVRSDSSRSRGRVDRAWLSLVAVEPAALAPSEWNALAAQLKVPASELRKVQGLVPIQGAHRPSDAARVATELASTYQGVRAVHGGKPNGATLGGAIGLLGFGAFGLTASVFASSGAFLLFAMLGILLSVVMILVGRSRAKKEKDAFDGAVRTLEELQRRSIALSAPGWEQLFQARRELASADLDLEEETRRLVLLDSAEEDLLAGNPEAAQGRLASAGKRPTSEQQSKVAAWQAKQQEKRL